MRNDVVNHSGCREGYTIVPAEVNLSLDYNNKELLARKLYLRAYHQHKSLATLHNTLWYIVIHATHLRCNLMFIVGVVNTTT